MGTLAISFGLPQGPDVGIATEVFDDDGRCVWLGITTPAGPTSVSVTAGTFFVRAHLPSGDDAVGQATVTDRSTVVLHTERGATAKPWDWARPSQPHFSSHARRRLCDGDLALWVRRVPQAYRTAGSANTGWTRHHLPLQPGMYDDRCEVIFVAPDAPSGVFARLRFWEPLDRDVQAWLSVGPSLHAIPRGMATDVLISPGDEPDNEPFAVTVRNMAPDAEAMLGYLSNGQFTWASTVAPRLIDIDAGLRHAESLVLAEQANPAAATIAAYYVLRAADTAGLSNDRRLHLSDWMSLLAAEFPAFPDAAIICGWDALRLADAAFAKRAFVEACRRGLPLYTMGLRYLVDGLRLTAGGDDEATRALDWLARYAPKADWSARTSTLRIDEAFEPLDVTAWPMSNGLRSAVRLLETWTSPERASEQRTWSVEFGVRAARAMVGAAMASEDAVPVLVGFVAGLRLDPFAYQTLRAGTPKLRYGVVYIDDVAFRIAFTIDSADMMVTVLDVRGAPSTRLQEVPPDVPEPGGGPARPGEFDPMTLLSKEPARY